MTELTLSLDEKVVEEAKRLAAERNTSVEDMFARFVSDLARTNHPAPEEGGPLSRRALGLFGSPGNQTDREILTDALMEKYGLTE